jgi:hypothetical protein
MGGREVRPAATCFPRRDPNSACRNIASGTIQQLCPNHSTTDKGQEPTLDLEVTEDQDKRIMTDCKTSPRSNPKLNVGVVGLGRMGRRHAINFLEKVPRARLLCACSPMESDLAWANEVLVPHGVSVVPTFDDMITTPGLEAVIIASATPFHVSQTRTALEMGIHVLCEKPVTKDMQEVSASMRHPLSRELIVLS